LTRSQISIDFQIKGMVIYASDEDRAKMCRGSLYVWWVFKI